MLTELFEQLQKVGGRVIVLLTGHYGLLQVDCIKRTAFNYQKEHPEISIIARAEYEGIAIDGKTPADHAGKWETSIFSCFYPQLVHMEHFQMETQKKYIYENPRHDFYKETEEWNWGEDLRETVSVELGERTVEAITDLLLADIKECLMPNYIAK